MGKTTGNIDIADIDNAIQMLTRYVKEPGIKPLISVLEALKEDLNNEALLSQLTDVWRNLGLLQGSVLTYVPNFYTFIPDDIFGDDK